MTKPRLFLFVAGLLFLMGLFSLDSRPAAAAVDNMSAPTILQELKSFAQMATLLHVAAHPDDENTQLIAYFARGRGYRTGYLSLTRGDGGQNVLGPEFGATLGYIRTEELLAARRIDGGRQFFTRALDFGFSKDYRETLEFWGRDNILADIVRVIRTFRPDVMVTRFSTAPGNTHGHHTASAILAVEAFALAGDPKAYPEEIKGLPPWQPKRIFMNGMGAGAGASGPTVYVDIGGSDPVSGSTFGELAGRSRSMHKSQGFGNIGAFGKGGAKSESFQLIRGEPASKDIFDGIDTTWGRVAGGGAEVAKLTAEAIEKFDAANPAASVPALLAIRKRVVSLPADPLVSEKLGQLDRVIMGCLGLTAETTLADAEVVPGETFKLTHTVNVASQVPVRWLGVRYPANKQEVGKPMTLQPGKVAMKDASQILAAKMPLSQPYWLREDSSVGLFQVADHSLIGRPENPPAFPVEYVFEVAGDKIVVPDEPVQIITDAGKKTETRRRLEVVAPVALKFTSEVSLFAPGASKLVEVEVTAQRPDSLGTVKLEAPPEWKVDSTGQLFRLEKIGDHRRFSFRVTAPAKAATGQLAASVEVNGARYANERVEIRYDHLPPLLLQPQARVKTVGLDLAIRGQQVGYIPGAGDSIAEALTEMGYAVTTLNGPDITAEKLKDLDAVIVGIRAFNVRTDLTPKMAILFAYVEAGGTLIEQYNNPNGLKVDKLAPYDLKISQDRVTDETAKMTFLAPEHAVLNMPNKITDADFEGWVQERGLYFPNQWDSHFVPILACNDPGQNASKGSLLVAEYGKGHVVYTGLAFFRQLPGGVPGSYRLFANLVSLGKSKS